MGSKSVSSLLIALLSLWILSMVFDIYKQSASESEVGMKHWKTGRVQHSHGEEGILLIDGDIDHTLSLSMTDDGKVVIMEECDACYCVELTKQDAIDALQEAIDWIGGQEDG